MANLHKSSLFSIFKSYINLKNTWSIEIILINIKSSKLLVTWTNKYKLVFAFNLSRITT